MENRTYYEILGVSKKATQDEITQAKNLLAKRYHPDVNMRRGIDTTRQMQEILDKNEVEPGPDSKTIGIIYRVGELMMNDKDYRLARDCFSIVYDITQEAQLKTLLDELDKDLEDNNA